MKTKDPRDPLDQKIDALLASQPVRASADFSERLLERVDQLPRRKGASPVAALLRFALPLAAAVALLFAIFSQLSPESVEPGSSQLSQHEPDSAALNDYEIQELLMLQEGLSSFAQIDADGFDSSDLLDTLDTLYSI